MVDIESADATSAPVIRIRFKLASFFVEQKRRTMRAIVGSRPTTCFSRCERMPLQAKHLYLPNYQPGGTNPHRSG
jgi:hypothetical protein